MRQARCQLFEIGDLNKPRTIHAVMCCARRAELATSGNRSHPQILFSGHAPAGNMAQVPNLTCAGSAAATCLQAAAAACCCCAARARWSCSTAVMARRQPQ